MKSSRARQENDRGSQDEGGVDNVSPESIRAAQEFLRTLTRSVHNVLYDEERLLQEIKLLLPAEFKGIEIIKHGSQIGNFLRKFTAYPGLSDTMSTIPAFNVWFTRNNGEWTLYYNVVRANSLNPPL